MPLNNRKKWHYTKLSQAASVRLNMDGVNYDLASVTTNFAINSIPEAICALAIGRQAKNTNNASNVHLHSGEWKRMLKAQVFFTAGESSEDWPSGEQLIFDGYFTGFGYRKIRGQVQLTIHLIHWLFDLARSSSLSVSASPGSPPNLAAPAICLPDSQTGGASSTGEGLKSAHFLGQFLGAEDVESMVKQDMWGAIKTLLSAMTRQNGYAPQCGPDAGKASVAKNDAALAALKRIEGPDKADASGDGTFNVDGSKGYKYAMPTPLITAVNDTYGGLAESLSRRATVSVWGETLWDLLVRDYGSEFLLAVCPAVDRTLVIPDVPVYSGTVWQTLLADEYDYVDQTAMLATPLRGVVAYGATMTQNGADFWAKAAGAAVPGSCFAGAFAPEGVDGVIMYTQIPSWVQAQIYAGVNAGTACGITKQTVVNQATGPTKDAPPPPTKSPDVLSSAVLDANALNRYAQAVYYREVLRGRSGAFSGKLRFDIAPGSQLMVEGNPERFIGTADSLAGNMFGQVNRVTCEINAEGRRAGTSFVLTHHRNEAENKDSATSTDLHPFLGGTINGFPLSVAFAPKE